MFGFCQNAQEYASVPDDGQFCNGTVFCDAVSDCSSTGDPYGSGEIYNETTDTCHPCVPKNDDCTSGAEYCSRVCKNNGRYR